MSENDATVLVVEDTLVNRLALVRGVEQLGHRVLQADGGRQALDTLAEQHVDMVLLDLLMPEVDGFEVLERIAAQPEWHRIPVLVVSAIEETEDIARAIELGAIDCLPKPFEPLLLRVRVRVALEQARLRGMEREYLRQEITLRQQERLATLGRLSAGLGHELNNPASAALSAARQLLAALTSAEAVLPLLLERADGTQLVAAMTRVLDPDGRDGGSGVGDRGEEDGLQTESELEAVLTDARVPEPWNLAPDLAVLGVDPVRLRRELALLGDGAPVAARWLASQARSRQLVESITASVSRMAALTSALRGYSNLDRAPQQDVDVRQALEETLTILEHKIPAGVTVTRAFAEGLPTIQALGAELNQVWTHLLDNAIDAIGEQGRVVVRAKPHGDGVAVEVEDDGPGISPDLRGDVFDPFVTSKEPGEGTGLGLNTAHQIVANHGGRIGFESAPGCTVFRVELPALPPGEDPRQRG